MTKRRLSIVLTAIALTATIRLWLCSFRGASDQRGEIWAWLTPQQHAVLTLDSLQGRLQFQYAALPDKAQIIGTMMISDNQQADAHGVYVWLQPTEDHSGLGNIGRDSERSSYPSPPGNRVSSSCGGISPPAHWSSHWGTVRLPSTSGVWCGTGGDWRLFIGFKSGTGNAATVLGGTNFIIQVPHWSIALPLAVVLYILGCKELTIRRRSRQNKCLACGYDLRAQIAGVAGPNCPECGTPIPSAAKPPS